MKENVVKMEDLNKKESASMKLKSTDINPNCKVCGVTSVDKTPFSLLHIETEEGVKYVPAIGANVITIETFNTIEEAEKFIKKPTWEVIWNLIYLICDQREATKNKENKQ